MPTDGSVVDADWLVMVDAEGNRVLTVQEKKDTTPPTWPSEAVPMQMHMDFKCRRWMTLNAIERAEELGRR